MLVNVIGIQRLDFDTNDGGHIEGTNLFCAYKDDNVEGMKAERFFVKKEIELPKQIQAGDKLNIFFNQKGRVEAVTK